MDGWSGRIAVGRPGRRGAGRRAAAVLAGVGLLAGGCRAGKAEPAAVVELPRPVAAAVLSSVTREVRLSVGQVVAVQVVRQALPSSWKQVDAGSAAVLQPDGEDTVASCPDSRPGCASTVRERYRAVAAGSTTIEWNFTGMGPQRAPAGVPTAPCPAYGAAARCPVGIMKILVTVT